MDKMKKLKNADGFIVVRFFSECCNFQILMSLKIQILLDKDGYRELENVFQPYRFMSLTYARWAQITKNSTKRIL